MKLISSIVVAIALVGCSVQSPLPVAVLSTGDLKWEPLNPARGDKSPQAATLWGDRNGKSATGFLVKFVDGFSSPPHIHNVSYRGVVLEGLVHNDDPGAAHMWMPAGSYWTQPKGEVHITAAKGATNIAYIEIEEGPYLVRPSKKAFDSGERPVNVDPSNLVWFESDSVSGVEQAFLWGQPEDKQLHGTFLRLSPGTSVALKGPSMLQVVAVAGSYKLDSSAAEWLKPGSSFRSNDNESTLIICEDEQSCTFYVRASNKYRVVSR